MLKTLLPLLALPIVLNAAPAHAESLESYVTACKSSLGLPADTAFPQLNCNDGVRFAFTPGGLINDFLGYKRINNYVDLTFACRWLQKNGNIDQGPFPTAASLEMIIHNRQNGNTCFFAAKPSEPPTDLALNGVSTTIVSPTASDASSYWMQPDYLNSLVPNVSTSGSTLKCVSCHVAGPYIASKRIAPFLAQFGLLNNGHTTFSGNYTPVGTNDQNSAFNQWNNIKNNLAISTGCNQNCHAIANTSGSAPSIIGRTGIPLIPSIANDIQEVKANSLMPPAGVSDYRWMNIDIPDDPNTTGDVEDFYTLKADWVGFTHDQNNNLVCETEPAYAEARVVGSAITYKSNEYSTANVPLPDRLERFDQNGLVCRNADQSGHPCSNYAVRFVCQPDQLSVYSRWTGRVLTIANPDANQVRWARGQPLTAAWYGSQTWHIAGVNDGVHHNYVRFRNDWSGNYLNADISLSVAVAGLRNDWLSEQWVMEYVPGTRYVRFRNLWQPGYLTMVEDSDYSAVNMQPLHPEWLSQQWELK